MVLKPVSLATATVLLLSTVSQTVAGGKAVECYERYTTPAVYETVHEQVLLRAATSRVEVTAAIYGTRKVRVVVTPERVTYRHVPARYGYVEEKVVVEPARTVKRTIPAVVKTVHSKVKVSDGGYYWEWRVIKGKKVLCKVKAKAQYKTVTETVVVEPARVVKETLPATYGYQKRKVIVSEGYDEKVVVPAEYGYVQEKVLIEPERRRLVETPAVYETRARQVKVSDGTSGWQRVEIPRHCK
ncbi:MAG: hypothetical protein KF723_22865 [Rhizobiaceae bacterium]|nr:hypothetical protein [Rhizobiaceae bacterium]